MCVTNRSAGCGLTALFAQPTVIIWFTTKHPSANEQGLMTETSNERELKMLVPSLWMKCLFQTQVTCLPQKALNPSEHCCLRAIRVLRSAGRLPKLSRRGATAAFLQRRWLVRLPQSRRTAGARSRGLHTVACTDSLDRSASISDLAGYPMLYPCIRLYFGFLLMND
eukprot:6197199-Pleurochrysis_carterae.AAC.1